MQIRAVVWTAIGQSSLAATGIVTAALVNRAIAPEGRGIVAEAQTLAGLFAILMGLSLPAAIYHFANRERYGFGDDARLFLVLVTSLATSLLSVTALAFVLYGTPRLLSPSIVSIFPWLLAFSVAAIFSANLQALGVALGRIRMTAITSLSVSGANLILIVPAYLAGVIDVRYALFVSVAVQAMGAVIIAGVVFSSVGCSIRGLTLSVSTKFLAAGLKQHVGTIALFLSTRFNQLIVSHYWGEVEAGLFAAAHTLAFGCFALFAAIQTVLYSHVARTEGDGLAATTAMVRISIYTGVVVLIPTLAASDLIVRAYGGQQFAESSLCFRLLVPAAWILAVSSMTAPYYVKAGAFWMASLCSLIVATVGLSANLLLVPDFAANGAAAATLISVTVGFGAVLGMLRLLSGSWHLRMLVPDFRQHYGELRSIASKFRASR